MIDSLIRDHRILIVGGSGGVGKTSISAALAIRLAIAGHRTLVLTIDPARRLAAALGLEEMGPEAVDVTPRLVAAGLQPAGELHAMMLDVENTMNRLVERYAPDAASRRRIQENRLYRNISTRLSGSQEYAAMQRLYEIASERRFDRIILDTPPSTQALDFLTAPKRLVEFFDSRLIQVFVGVGSRAGRGLFRISDGLIRALERLTGSGVIRDISEFFTIADSIMQPFHDQSRRAEAMLRRADTRFVVVTGPRSSQLEDARQFRARLESMRIGVRAMVVNRWLPPLSGDFQAGDVQRRDVQNTDVDPVNFSIGEMPGEDRSVASDPGDRLASEIKMRALQLERLAIGQTRAIIEIERNVGLPVFRVPELDHDVHSIEGLLEINRHLGACRA
ncbi:MAG: ArsA-related P-loop ATPase [Wenzhouxiangellaceae bacterium]|nr:ArsA-related P-loop ATPase [Wenzhouxiangellaceae bacterium]